MVSFRRPVPLFGIYYYIILYHSFRLLGQIKICCNYYHFKTLKKREFTFKEFKCLLLTSKLKPCVIIKAGGNRAVKEGNELARLPYLREWFRTRTAIVLHLSNGILQVCKALNSHVKVRVNFNECT